MDSRLRGNDKEKQIRNPNIGILNKFECSKIQKKKRKRMDSRLRGNDKQTKTRKNKKNMGKMPMLRHGRDVQATDKHSPRVIPAQAGIQFLLLKKSV